MPAGVERSPCSGAAEGVDERGEKEEEDGKEGGMVPARPADIIKYLQQELLASAMKEKNALIKSMQHEMLAIKQKEVTSLVATSLSPGWPSSTDPGGRDHDCLQYP